MSRKIHTVKPEPRKGKEKPQEQPLTKREIDQLTRDLKGENGLLRQKQAGEKLADYLDGDHIFQVKRQAFRIAQEKVKPSPITGSKQLLAVAEKQIVRTGKKQTPASVIAIFDLAQALNNYKGDPKKGLISLSTNLARLSVAASLGEAVQEYLENKDKRNAEQEFQTTCTKIMAENYKYLAADVSVWNVIKEFLIKPALEFLHIDTKRLLSSNDLIKNVQVQGMFKKAVKEGGIEIADEKQIDTDLYKP